MNNNAQKPNPQKPNGAPRRRLYVTITWTPGQPARVTGPINDKAACYAMLEMAKDAIRDHIAANKSSIVKAVALPG
jgi:hypothetical protein